jgi:hypothetical protein
VISCLPGAAVGAVSTLSVAGATNFIPYPTILPAKNMLNYGLTMVYLFVRKRQVLLVLWALAFQVL